MKKSEARKSSIQQALDYSTKLTPSFIFEDTQDKSYRNIVEVFEVNNWKKIPYRKRNKIVEKKR
jgi:hypothetical protein